MTIPTPTAERTSRIGRKPIILPAGVEAKFHDHQLQVKGAKGQLSALVHEFVSLNIEKNEIQVSLNEASKKNVTASKKKLQKSLAGTWRAKIQNMVQGVNQGFEIKLALVGVGYRAQSKGKVLGLSLGFSHPTDYALPEGVVAETPTPTEVIIKGINKDLVGLVAAQIRDIRSPEPYKGKGIRYANERIELKETKKK
jgi:large subunit ribosomal protein L6